VASAGQSFSEARARIACRTAPVRRGTPAPGNVVIGGLWNTPWNMTAHPSWIVPSATSGNTTSNVTLGFDPTGLGTGTFHGTVTFSNGTDTANVDATLTITGP
jgi:hypothetical protein